jgi:VIT1/CCC1 family predicted Fe2+/Mn2+ transporter
MYVIRYNRKTDNLKAETMTDNDRIQKILKTAQKTEITEYIIYRKLAGYVKDESNRNVLRQISADELKHYRLWRGHTGRTMRPKWIMVWTFYLLSRVFGLSFGIKLMERGEKKAQAAYDALAETVPEAPDIAAEEDEHEQQLVGMINEERLEYVGSMIRGLNDALVELTGALAGFTFALQASRLVAMVGLITGIAASLSMATTEYLAIKSEESRKKPLTSALYTGTAYVFTVLFLVLPYLLIPNVFVALAVMIIDALLVIVIFNFYISVAKEQSFLKRFSEMAVLSLGIAAISFGIGFLMRELLGVDV